jgi:type I restriction enzyme S subunit
MSIELPGGWQLTAIADVAEVVGGGTPSTKDPMHFGEDVPWITPKDLSTHRGRYIGRGARSLSHAGYRACSARRLPPGTVLVSSRAPVGLVAIAEQEVTTNQGCRSLVLRAEHSPQFFYYSMLASRSRMEAAAGGTTFREISGSALKTLKVAVPPPAEQARIAAVLGTLDDKIESNERLGHLAERLAGELFRTRLHRLDDRRAPSSWPRMPFSQAVELNPKIRMKRGTPAPFVEMAACGAFETRPSDVGTRPVAGGARFAPGDVLFARITPCTENGKGAFVDFLETPGTGSTEFIVMRPDSLLTTEAVWLLSRDERIRSHAIQAMTGSSGRQRVPTGCFDGICIAVPPSLDDWAETAQQLTFLIRVGLAAWGENRRLESLRDALMARLVNRRLLLPGTGDLDALIEQTHAPEAGIAAPRATMT